MDFVFDILTKCTAWPVYWQRRPHQVPAQVRTPLATTTGSESRASCHGDSATSDRESGGLAYVTWLVLAAIAVITAGGQWSLAIPAMVWTGTSDWISESPHY